MIIPLIYSEMKDNTGDFMKSELEKEIRKSFTLKDFRFGKDYGLVLMSDFGDNYRFIPISGTCRCCGVLLNAEK